MLLHNHLQHCFVKYLPEQLESGIIYISMDYATATHNCCCGCGEPVITPFTPTDWRLIFDGEAVSLWPSIGNWNFPCRSHYIIRFGRIIEAEPWKDEQVVRGRIIDKLRKGKYFGTETIHDRKSDPSGLVGDPGSKSLKQIKYK